MLCLQLCCRSQSGWQVEALTLCSRESFSTIPPYTTCYASCVAQIQYYQNSIQCAVINIVNVSILLNQVKTCNSLVSTLFLLKICFLMFFVELYTFCGNKVFWCFKSRRMQFDSYRKSKRCNNFVGFWICLCATPVSIAFMEAFWSPVFRKNFSNGTLDVLRYPAVKGNGQAGVKAAIYAHTHTPFKLLC